MTNSPQARDGPGLAKQMLWLVAGLLAAALAVFAVFVAFVSWRVSSRMTGFQPPEMAAAQYTAKDVIGDLGGMKVRIPRYYAEYVEYDGDPGFGEKRKGPRPERTFDSRLRGFGMDVRFPDMKGLENWKIRDQKSRQPLKENMWFYIGINSGEHNPADGFLERRAERISLSTNTRHNVSWLDTFERMPEDEYELEVWQLSSTDPRTGRPARESVGAAFRDIYVHRDPSGHVDAYIDCSKPSVPNGIGTCTLDISLAPKARAEVSILFRRGLLPEWKQIEQSSRKLLLSFEVDPSAAATAASAPASAQQASRDEAQRNPSAEPANPTNRPHEQNPETQKQELPAPAVQ